jgi:hypothetical protein
MATAKNLTITEAAKPAVTIAEGTRVELETNGHAISPFTGARLVGSGVNDVRVVDEKEYLAAVKAAAAKRELGRDVTRL